MVKEPLDSKYLSATYPQVGMPFYLYGSTQDSEYHIDHTLAAAPNAQFTAGEVTVDLDDGGALPTFTDDSPYLKIIVNFPERAMQPFPSDKDIATDPDFFFRSDKVLPFTATTDDGTDLKGSVTLTNNVFIDTDMLNEDPVPERGKCYARGYSLRAHAYAVALLGADVHTTRMDPIAIAREWHNIIVCTWSLTWA